MASRETIWVGIRAGLTYEQNALLRAYGAATYEERARLGWYRHRHIGARHGV